MKQAFILFVITLGLFSCVEKGEAVEVNSQGNFQVELLFEMDSCRMYRFRDGGRYIYWSNCQGKTERSYTRRSGKGSSTHYEETLTTVK